MPPLYGQELGRLRTGQHRALNPRHQHILPNL